MVQPGMIRPRAVRPGGNDGLQRCHAMLRPVSLRALLPWLMSIIGIASALCMVIAWFPSTVWNTPIVSSDAPAHYYFIRRLLDEGLGRLCICGRMIRFIRRCFTSVLTL